MTPTIYNVSMGAGVASVGVGVGAQWGWPFGLMAVGALVLCLTVFTVRMIRGR